MAMVGQFVISSSRRSRSSFHLSQLTLQRLLHSRNKKATEYIARGWSALKEVDRVIDFADINDSRLLPLLTTAKTQFELALEVDSTNVHARLWLSRVHFDYFTPGACVGIGAALLNEAANMGDPDAQYELGCRLRVENEYVNADQQAFEYIEKAVGQLHPGALYLFGIVCLTGDCVPQSVDTALWCFHRASRKGHAGAAVAYGSLLLKGHRIPESITKFYKQRPSLAKSSRAVTYTDLNPLEMAKEQFEIAAKAGTPGSELGFKWLKRIEEEEKRILAEEEKRILAEEETSEGVAA